jgi:hypothetical protein
MLCDCQLKRIVAGLILSVFTPKNFLLKENFIIGYPFSYGDTISEDEDSKRFSNHVVSVLKNKRFQSHCTSVAGAILFLALNAPGASASDMPGSEYEEFLKGAGPNGGPFQPQPNGQLPNQQPNIVHAMPVDMQQKLAAQQAGGLYKPMPTPGPGGSGPTSPPSFYLPAKPAKVGPRAINTIAFTASLGVICLNAVWGEPVAILMCSSGLVGIAYRLGKEVVIYMAKNLN